VSSENDKRLLDQVWDVMRLKHYSIHTEWAYCDWIKRYVLYHGMTSREDWQTERTRLNYSAVMFCSGFYSCCACGRTKGVPL